MHLQLHREHGSVQIAGHADGSAVHVHDLLGNGKPQPRASGAAGPGPLHAVKLVEDERQLIRRDHIPVVCHRDRHHFLPGKDLNQHPLSVRAVLDGVSDQVVEQPGQQIAVRGNHLRRNVAL